VTEDAMDDYTRAYIADVAVHPDHQGRGLGKAIISRLVTAAQGHKKIMARPGSRYQVGPPARKSLTWLDPALEPVLLSAGGGEPARRGGGP
jgi:GNAT superfamily N-acetyltransferase